MNFLFKALVLVICPFIWVFSGEAIQQSQYKMYCMYTPDFEGMFKEFFLPSLKDDFELIVYAYPQECPSGNFREAGWDRTMLNKLEMLQQAILDNWNNQIFFYSDIDIIFLRPILEASLQHLGMSDFVVQQGWPRDKLCAGFFVMRGNEKTLSLITEAYNLLEQKLCVDDQEAIQRVLDRSKSGTFQWHFLPAQQYPNGRRVIKHTTGHYTPESEIELFDDMVLFHANCCIGYDNKIHFLRRVQNEFSKRINSQ